MSSEVDSRTPTVRVGIGDRGRAVLAFGSSYRASAGFAALVLAGSAGAGTIVAPASAKSLQLWAVSDPSFAQHHHWWTALTALAIAQGPLQLAIVLLLGAPLLGALETRVGHRLLAVMLVVGGVLAVVVGLLAQSIGHEIGARWPGDLQSEYVLDPAIAVVAAAMAASAFLGSLWRRRLRLTGIGLVTVFALYNGDSADVYRFLAASVGLAVGAVLARRLDPRPSSPVPASFRERRTLLSLIVFITAFGPAVAALNPSGVGVLTLFRSIFGNPFPHGSAVRAACAVESALSCAHDRAFLDARGIAPLLELFVPLVLLAIGAWGLRRGRRFGMWLTVWTNLALAALSVCVVIALQARYPNVDSPAWLKPHGVADAVELGAWVLGPVLLPLGVAAATVWNAKLFTLTAPRARIIAFWAGSSAALVALSGAYLVLALTHRAAFTPSPDVPSVVFDAFMRFVPVNFLTNHRHVIVPHAQGLRAVFHWVGPLFWAIVATLAIRALTRRADFKPGREGNRLDRLVRAGGNTLSHMALWDGNDAWFAPRGDAAIAYRTVNDVAVTIADPIGPDGSLDDAIDGFIGYCDRNGWTAAFYSVHEPTRLRLAAKGFRSTEVALEAVVDPTTFTTRGKSANSIRTALNRAAKDEVEAVWSSYDDLPPAVQEQLIRLSTDWVANKELPEMGFTLGGLSELQDPEVRLMIALDADEHLAGVTSWLPVYRDQIIVGWTLDVMRRAAAGMPGVMEFLIASVAIRLREAGLQVMSLSGAPLATTQHATSDSRRRPLDSTLAFLSRRLEPAYGFASLLKYKAKFGPRYQSLYLCYRDPLQLPAIGRAIASAYLPDVTAGEILSLARFVTTNR
jgi:lysylphosphatidylglycerol synthetase-like protein (DUF2156 family)